MVAPEDLRELGRLAVSHRRRHRLDRHAAAQEQLGGPLHADALELAAEGRAAHLGQGTLELPAAGGDLVRHPGERQVRVPVQANDRLESLAV